ncbi:MAG: hypothetical protein M0T71_05235 [Actinomycetota bacterium]|nr:hypothetical protein [Actinomycetota bacterium]
MTEAGSPLFLVALRLEALTLRLGAAGVDWERIGMGPVRAVAACSRISRQPDRRPVVLVGCAGALDPALRPGDLVVASSLVEVDRPGSVVPLAHADEVHARVQAAPGIAGTGVAVHLAPIVSSPRILHGDEARSLARRSGAAVDMESLWCAPLGRTRPFAVVRSILDVPGKDLFTLSTAAVALRSARSLAAAARALASWHPGSLESDTLMEIGER